MSRPRPKSAPELEGPGSPPCMADEFPDYFGERPGDRPVLDPETEAALNALLEAERAGAKVLAVLRDGLDPRSPVRELLTRLQQDEGANAVILYKTIRRLGGGPSHETGAFVGRTLAIEGLVPRLEFLNRGQMWVVKRIAEVLPRIDDQAAREMLESMRVSHLDNIAACESLLKGM